MLHVNRRRLGLLVAAASLTLPVVGFDGTASAKKHKRARLTTTVLGAFTSQDWPVLFRVTTNRRLIVRAEVIINLKCQSGSTLTGVGANFQIVPVGLSRRFSAMNKLSPIALSNGSTIEYTFQLSGRFSKAGTAIVGTSHDKAIVRNAAAVSIDSCDSGTISFIAVD